VQSLPDTEVVHHWCRAGLAGLAAAREEIDALNVYPVPDRDTGTNLFLTMEAAVTAAQKRGDARTAELVEALAEGALAGARGNCGIIVAQMLRGVADALAAPDAVVFDGQALADGLTRAAQYAYGAVAAPVEGTILTVVKAASAAAQTCAATPGATLADVASAAASASREALAKTPEQLDVLREAGVVDAGGRGLTVLLDALDMVVTGRAALAGPPLRTAVHTPSFPSDRDPYRTSSEPTYEVVYLLEASNEQVITLKARLVELGESLVVAGGPELWKIHVHVDDAGAAIEAGVRAGRPHEIHITHLDVARAVQLDPPGRVVVAFVVGDGLAQLFTSAGAIVVTTATGRLPTTSEMLAAAAQYGPDDEVVFLPNGVDVVAVTEAAAIMIRSAGRRVAVIPTVAQVQGLAALAVHDPTRPFDVDVVAMSTAAGRTRHATVSTKTAAQASGARPGDVVGMIDSGFCVFGSVPLAVATDVMGRMLAAGGELVTVITGAQAQPGLGDDLVAAIRQTYPDVDVVAYGDGPAHCAVLLGVE
jgi:hypothetical protein